MKVDRNRDAEVRNRDQGDAGVDAAQDVHHSDDPRDFGWVHENVPCQSACPAGTDIPAYILAILQGKRGLSYEINREANVLPGVLGRICSRPCEDQCRHGWPGNGEPVSICHLKRAAADLKDIGHRLNESLYGPSGKRVAIVGSGPAGIAAAHDLSLMGHDVTLFEREKQAGGMLMYGIPEFRLPRDILREEIHNALRLGVDLKTGVSIGNGKGETPLSELRNNYDAVLLATGCMAATDLPLRDALKGGSVDEITNIEYGFDFLLDLHRGLEKKVGKRVAVVGAGFTALDCARVARRLGAEDVTIHLRTTEEYIPVTKDEILEAKREDVALLGLRTPVGIHSTKDGRLKSVEFVQNRLGGWRENGRRKAIAIEASEFEFDCDTLLVAIGQKTAHDFLDDKLTFDRWGNASINENGMTSLVGVFAAGDYVKGASTVIEAVGQGREIAKGIDTWLVGKPRYKQVVRIEKVTEPLRERSFDFIARCHMPTAEIEGRSASLGLEVENGFDEDLSHQEAKRCYLCNLKYNIDVDNCIYCRACIEVAPKNCIKMVEGIKINQDGTYGDLQETTEWDHVGAIWIDNNECIRCGACYNVCPTNCISITRNQLVQREF
ncbi:MAG: FAD-dependent oxidoreductase [Alphaproteobacteria bacterium]|nr:FAD-dependent oxidoreductase [Alphaproteobacteria bacterium]